jgi:hypothetical protein
MSDKELKATFKRAEDYWTWHISPNAKKDVPKDWFIEQLGTFGSVERKLAASVHADLLAENEKLAAEKAELHKNGLKLYNSSSRIIADQMEEIAALEAKLAGYEAMVGDANQIRKIARDEMSISWSMEKFDGTWLAYQDGFNTGKRSVSALEAFQSLKPDVPVEGNKKISG